MKMNKIYLTLLSAVSLVNMSCSDWLDATPPSQIPAEEHYSSVVGFQQTLTGCYMAMTDENLYGRSGSWLVPEILAHQFNPVNASPNTLGLYYMQEFEYGRPTSKEFIDNIWAKAYNVIVNANEALNRIDGKRDIMTETDYSIIKGELLAIRAYVHFDLARLYNYGNWADRKAEVDAKYAVPYVTSVSKDLTPQLTMREFYTRLTDDLAEAESLLRAEDPVTGTHPWSYYDEVNSNGYYDYRGLHLNYYAVRALQARVYLWEGSAESKTLALRAAEEVIANFGKVGSVSGSTNPWRWMDSNDQQTYQGMVMEQLFGIYVSDFSDLMDTYIKPDMMVTDTEALYITDTDRQEIYESHPTDWRMRDWYHLSTMSSANPYTCIKLQSRTGASNYFSNRMPMIRIPEVYYIAAECCTTGPDPDLNKAMGYLNTVREHRAVYEPLEGLDATGVMNEIAKEYRKEFPLEGVMFYFYKRLGETYIPHLDESMGDNQYVLPFPDFEIQSGRIQ